MKGRIRMRSWIISAMVLGLIIPGYGMDESIRAFRPIDPVQLEKRVPQGFGKVFVEAGRQNNIDPLFLAAISAHESGAWRSKAARNKNNWMGLMTRNGTKRFSNPEASIFYAAALLNRKPFKGRNSIGSIAAIYCATSPSSWRAAILEWRRELAPDEAHSLKKR